MARNKRQIWITLHPRGALSLGENRIRLGHASFHWGILVSPKTSTGADCHLYDVTDSVFLDPDTQKPRTDWRFRHNPNEDPQHNPSILGMVMIDKIPNSIGFDAIETHLSAIPLPEKDAQPVQNCVTWTRAAIEKFQGLGFVEKSDIGRFMDEAAAFADRRIRDTATTPREINSTDRPR